MIDLNAIEKGQLYTNLKENIVIFICKFDPFGRSLPRYTFENICIENKELYLGDGTSKVFFNAKDYDKENKEDLKSFLEYVDSNVVGENDFVKSIAKKVKEIKENKEMRAEYMTLLMREREIAHENFEKGKAEGLEEGTSKGIKNLCDSLKELGIDKETIKMKLINKYELSEDEVQKYL